MRQNRKPGKISEFLTKNQIRDRINNNRDDAVVVTDNMAVVEMINRKFTKLFGYTEEEALGRPVHDLILHDHEKADLIKSRFSTVNDKENKSKTVISRKNGRLINVISRISPIMMGNQAIGCFACYRDTI